MLQNEIKFTGLLASFLGSFGHWESGCKPSRYSWSSFPCVYHRQISLPSADWSHNPSPLCKLFSFQKNPNNHKKSYKMENCHSSFNTI